MSSDIFDELELSPFLSELLNYSLYLSLALQLNWNYVQRFIIGNLEVSDGEISEFVQKIFELLHIVLFNSPLHVNDILIISENSRNFAATNHNSIQFVDCLVRAVFVIILNVGLSSFVTLFIDKFDGKDLPKLLAEIFQIFLSHGFRQVGQINIGFFVNFGVLHFRIDLNFIFSQNFTIQLLKCLFGIIGMQKIDKSKSS